MAGEDYDYVNRPEVEALKSIARALWKIVHLLELPYRATSARLTLRGGDMPTSLTVDQTGTASLTFEDDHGDVTSAPLDPTGAAVTVAFTSDNTAVATVDPVAGTVTPVVVGTFNLGANVTNADGSQTLEPDGVTPFSTSAACTVTAGAAATDALSVTVA